MKYLAAFTICRDEPKHLRRWIRHYLAEEIDDLYVLNHGSSGEPLQEIRGLCNDNRVNLVNVVNDTVYDGGWLCRTAINFQRFLLDNYRLVLFSGVDELVVSVTGYLAKYLVNYVNKQKPKICVADGWEAVDEAVVQTGLSCPGYPCRRYTKPVLGHVPILWRAGFYQADNVQPVESALSLLHLHKLHVEEAAEKHRRIAGEVFYEGESNRMYQHNLIKHPDQLRLWMKAHADNTQQFADFSELPALFANTIRYADGQLADAGNLLHAPAAFDT